MMITHILAVVGALFIVFICSLIKTGKKADDSEDETSRLLPPRRQ